MKKNTIIAVIAAASAILLCASCQKQELIEQNNGINAEGKVFTATINQGLTKSTITSDFKVNWEMGDEVSINEVKYTATPDANDPTKATLAPTGSKGAVALDGKYKALYPYSLLVPAEGQAPAYFEFPATQTYEVGKFNAPMYAESTTDAFTFNNICGVLCLSLKGTDKVKSISVTANEAICGIFEMTDTTTVNLTGEDKTVTLDCGTEGVQLDATTATNFYIYLPPNTYTAGMKILATNTEDYIFEMTTTKEVKIEMNNIYTFDWNATFINPVPPTFKAVYNYYSNTLTFYYNSRVYEYPDEVFEDDQTGYLFDDTRTGGAKWKYYDDHRRYNINSVVIDASVKDYKGLTNTAYMFYGLESANNISGEEYLDVSNVTDMSYMFSAFGKSSGLAEVPNVKDWNTGKVTNMSNMFSAYGEESSALAEVPDVSKWNTGNVTNMSNMFSAYGKYSSALAEVPDVSKWNTGNVTNMSNMFKDYGYFSALNKVPDVSKWNTGKVNDMSSMFNNYGYYSKDFNKVPDVSKWRTDGLTNMSSMFFSYGYSSTVLNEVPDVSLWETGNVTNMSSMFCWYGYSSTALAKVPDVSLWESGKVNDMSKMFSWYGYSSPVLATVPDVSGWNSHKVTTIGEMFYNYGASSSNIECTLDLSGWDLSNITSGNYVFGFKAKTFDVTIPDKTGTKDNTGDNWYYGSNGTGGSITPANGGHHFTTSDIPAGYFNGEFSVSTTQKVHFSKGNLYAKKEGDKWGWYFYDRQYQINSLYVYSYRTAQSTDTEIDLFCWGYDATGSVNPTERTTRNQFVDWGSTIDNNGTWRTLTQQEWDYLLNTRTVNGGTKEGKSYQRATINNDTSKPVYGLIVYPDDYTSQTTATIYTKREWAALEAEGCVFLPAAGYRSENYCTLNKGNGAKWGTYWTATAGGYGAYLMDFTNESVSTSNNDYALYGHSVRLVTNVTAE